MPISGRTARASATTSCPQIAARPAVGSRTVDSIFTRVVLPAPLGPNRPWTSPCGMASEMPSSARTGGFFRTVNSRTSSTTSTAGGMAITVTGSHVRPPPISARSVPSTLGGVTDEPETVLDAPVAAVTVYTDGARVTRRGALRLPAGEQRVVVDRLPLGLHPDSVRVSGRGPATVLGVDLVRRHHARTPDEAAAALEQRRRAADGALAELTDADAVQQERADFLAALSRRAGRTYADALASGGVLPADLAAFTEALAEQASDVRTRRRALAERRDQLRDEVAAITRQMSGIQAQRDPDRMAAVVSLDVSAEAEAEVELELTYVVDGAGWQPTYDIRLDSDRLALTWYALVSQRTGEDWPECELLLSTARPSGAVTVLDLAATLDYITAPVRSPEAHLRATAVNTSAHALLPGRAAVFHGGDFVGTTELATWAPGEEVELALGLDDRVRVERELVRRTATKATLGSTRRREAEYRITVANHTPRPARVTVLDQVPVSRDEGITVKELRAEPAPAERSDLGVLTWNLVLAPGKSREILLGLRVELAKGVEMAGWRE